MIKSVCLLCVWAVLLGLGCSDACVDLGMFGGGFGFVCVCVWWCVRACVRACVCVCVCVCFASGVSRCLWGCERVLCLLPPLHCIWVPV